MIYSFYKIISNFRTYYNFTSGKFDVIEDHKTEDHNTTDLAMAKKAFFTVWDEEHEKPWGHAHYPVMTKTEQTK